MTVYFKNLKEKTFLKKSPLLYLLFSLLLWGSPFLSLAQKEIKEEIKKEEKDEFHPKLAQSKKWRKDRVLRGFTIYTSQEKNSVIFPIKVEGTIEAPIDAVLENLRTVEGSESWTPNLIKKITLEDRGDREAITYSLNDMPWPLYNRVLILHNKLFLDKERKLLFILSKTTSSKGKKIPREKKSLEAIVGYSNLGLRPVDAQKTFIEFTAWVDPKGSIPAWLINFFQKKWPVTFFEALEKRCKKHRPPLRAGLRTMLQDLLKSMDWKGDLFNLSPLSP